MGGTIYMHYKGGIYRVIGEGLHSETQEKMTVYQSVNDSQIWVRPSAMFNELVELPNGKLVERFKKLEGYNG